VQTLTQLLAAPVPALAADFAVVFGTSWPCWAVARVIPHPNANAASKTDQPMRWSSLHPFIDPFISTLPRFQWPVQAVEQPPQYLDWVNT
jgi:hypothetical protein